MHTGYFKVKTDEGFETMKQGNICGLNEIELYKYLHGNCDEFAEALNETFGYEICSLWDKTKDRLIHAYCVCNVKNTKYYIDVRGITDDFVEFIKEFKDECNEAEDVMYIENKTSDAFFDLLASKDEFWLEPENFECSLELQKLISTPKFMTEYSVQTAL